MNSGRTRHAAVASCTDLASRAALRLIDQGGNAFDAAVACAFNLMVSNPLMCSVAGGGFACVKQPGQTPRIFDFFSSMPGKGMPKEAFGHNPYHAYLEYGPGLDVIAGAGSVAVPATVKGLELLSRDFGKLPFKECLQPAIEDARKGIPVHKTFAYWMQISAERLHWITEASKRLLCREDGGIPLEGDILRNPDLAQTLERIAAEGGDVVYGGEIGQAMVDTLQANGGLLTRQDLLDYQVIERTPVSTQLGPATIYTNPPPSVGGVSLIQMLKVLQRMQPKAWSPQLRADIAQVMSGALADRFEKLDDLDGITKDDYIFERYKHIVPSGNTTHLCTQDDEGNCCSLTLSMGYGSGWVADGTGIHFDNCLGELELSPGGYHSLTPGERLVSNMTPSIAVGPDERDLLTLGTPGASRIATSQLQVLANLEIFGMDLAEALALPRMHAEEKKVYFEPDVEVDTSRLPEGWTCEAFDAPDMYFGGVQAIRFKHGRFEAASDPRRAGSARHLSID